MADNSVFITGATEGAFTDALKDLPPWATEKTAYKIQGILKKSLDAQTKTLAQLVKSYSGGGNNSNNSGNSQTNGELSKLVKLLAAQNAEEAKGKKRRKAKDAEDDKSLFNLKAYNTNQKRTTLMLNGLATASGAIISSAEQYVKTYDDLFKSGINVVSGNETATSGMLALNQVVTLTGLRLQTLQKVAEKYSTAVNAVGFLKFAKVTANATLSMRAMGYSSEETANLVGAYTDSQSHYTDMRRKSEQEITADVKVFGKQVNAASLAMGISREQVLANNKALAESSDMSVVEAQYGAEAAKNVSNALMGIRPELASKFLSLVSDSGSGLGILNPTVQDLISSTSSFSTEIMQMGKDMTTMSPKELRGKWGEMVDSPQWKSDLQRMHTLGLAGVNGAKTTEQLMSMMQNQTHKFNEATDGQIDTATKTEASIAGLQTEQEKFAASMQSLFVPLEYQIDTVTAGFKLLNTGVSALADNISATTRSNIGVGAVLASFVAGSLIPKLLNITSFFGMAGTSAGTAAGAIGTAASAAATLASGVAVAAAGAVGYVVGDQVVKPLIDSLVQTVSGVKDATLGTAIYDMMNGDPNAPSSVKNKVISDPKNPAPDTTKKNTEISVPKNPAPDTTKKNTEISVPKNPAPSVINSPSAIPANPVQSGANAADQAADKTATPVAPGIEKPLGNNGINSLIAFQTTVMQNILQKTEALVSISNDILRVSRTH